MFNNIGSKVKIVAVVLFVLGIIGNIVSGIIIVVMVNSIWGAYIGPLVIIIGFFFSWALALVVYAIGEIADNTDYIKNKIK